MDDFEVLELLEERKHLVDAVVITGGEPCLHSGLYDLISEIKERGFLVKLDTNGAFPKVLEKLLENNMLDYVAMDIKTSLNDLKYNDIIINSCDIIVF
jgi:pyruvate formate lyase activating enzyme